MNRPRVSIRTQLMTATALLVLLVVGAVVVLWTGSETALVRAEKRTAARQLATTAANAFMNELDDKNWSQVRIACENLVAAEPDFAYVLVHDARVGNRIVASSLPKALERYVPDVVPVGVTRNALAARHHPVATETWALRPVTVGRIQRIATGDRLVEVAAPIRSSSREFVGTFRVGLSLRAVDRATTHVLRTTLGIGALTLLIGLLGAWMGASRLTDPILDLQRNAAQIAAGDLGHRAQEAGAREIAALAGSFNEMTTALSHSIDRLKGTLTTFERFVPRNFLRVIAADGVENIAVGVANEGRLTVLFSDIRGYTTLSEGMSNLALFCLLNEYLGRIGTAIDAHGGFIDKYIGDAVMALFDDEHTDGACDAAIAMQQTLIGFNAERERDGLAPVHTGIGLHTGEVIMGTVGYASRIDSTVVGDPVNVASRVEGLTKQYGCPILVTGAVVDRLKDRDRFDLVLVAEAVRVKGKDEPIALWHLKNKPPA